MNDPNKLEPLDLTICEGDEINIVYPIELKNPELYDKESPYYKDICYNYNTNNKVDLIIADRQQEYSDNNKSLCEEDCTYVGYDRETKEVECSCQIKINIPLISEIKIDKNKLYKFFDIKKVGNFDVLKCINLLLSKEGLFKNIGFYAFIPPFVLYFVCVFIFYKKEYEIIKANIKDLIFARENLKYLQKKPKKKKKKKKKKQNKNKKYEGHMFLTYLKSKNIKIGDFNRNSNNNKRNITINKNTRNKRKIKPNISNRFVKENNNTIVEEKTEEEKKDTQIKETKENQIQNIQNEKEMNNEEIIKIKKKLKNSPPIKKSLLAHINISNYKKNKEKAKEKGELNEQDEERVKEIMQLNDREINELDYKEALKHDKRTFIQYYISLLKMKHLIFKCMNSKDYNSRIIKIFLCFLNFIINYAINALFFNDDNIHKISLDNGEFNLIYQLPKTIYSAGITLVFEQAFKFLALSETNILNFKHGKSDKNLLSAAQDVLRVLHCKFMVFFILSLLLLLLFWYYIACFCAVYRNTQFHLIKDNLISFAESMLTPLGINLLPGFFRMPGLKKKKPLMFKFGKIMQFL